MIRLAVPFAALTLAISLVAHRPAAASDNTAVERNAVKLSRAQTRFILRCGGCHGTLGQSPPRSVPTLFGAAGYFLCTPESRDYVIRLPNVSRALLDDGELAEVMNFVTIDLGGRSAPAGAVRFTAQEVHAIRARPLNTVPLIAYRAKVVRRLVRQCGAPAAMLDYGAPPRREPAKPR